MKGDIQLSKISPKAAVFFILINKFFENKMVVLKILSLLRLDYFHTSNVSFKLSPPENKACLCDVTVCLLSCNFIP